MNLRVETCDIGRWAVVTVAGELDVYTCPILRTELETLARCGRTHIVLDLPALDFTDSSGLGVMVGALKRALAANGHPTACITTLIYILSHSSFVPNGGLSMRMMSVEFPLRVSV